jgi:hypothetical protein
VRGFDVESKIFAPRSVLVLVVLLEPRRFPNENGNALGDWKLFDDPGQDACRCVTIDESRLYAGVDGSDGLSISIGNDAEACRPE